MVTLWLSVLIVVVLYLLLLSPSNFSFCEPLVLFVVLGVSLRIGRESGKIVQKDAQKTNNVIRTQHARPLQHNEPSAGQSQGQVVVMNPCRLQTSSRDWRRG